MQCTYMTRLANFSLLVDWHRTSSTDLVTNLPKYHESSQTTPKSTRQTVFGSVTLWIDGMFFGHICIVMSPFFLRSCMCSYFVALILYLFSRIKKVNYLPSKLPANSTSNVGMHCMPHLIELLGCFAPTYTLRHRRFFETMEKNLRCCVHFILFFHSINFVVFGTQTVEC